MNLGKYLKWQTIRKYMICILGVTAVEFALVAPAFFGLTYGVIETGRFFYVKTALQNAVDQSGRYVTMNSTADNATIITYAKERVLTQVANSTTFTISTDTVDATDFVTVNAVYNFDIIVNLIGIDSIEINVQARVPITN